MMHTTDTPLRPQERALALRQAIESIRVMPMGSGARAVALDVLHGALADVRAGGVIVFKPVRPAACDDEWFIHRADEAPRIFRSPPLRGLTAAWLAIKDGDRTHTVRAGDFAKPGALQADAVVRKAIHGPAVAWVERHTGCTPLAIAMRRIRVGGGLVRFTPSHDLPEFDTGE